MPERQLSTSPSPEQCRTNGTGHCQLYGWGHNTHWIHAKHVGRTPWGWRDGLVVGLDGRWVTVEYLREQHRVRLWHHEDLARELAAGAPVRVHEGFHVLGGPFGWLNVVVADGLGEVPTPEDAARWSQAVTGGVQDLGTGRALALDWDQPDECDQADRA